MIGAMYLNEQFILETDIKCLKHKDSKYFKDLEYVDVRPKAKICLAECISKRQITETDVHVFRTNCMNFLHEIMDIIVDRFPFQSF